MYLLVSPQIVVLKKKGKIYPPTHQEPQVITNRYKDEDMQIAYSCIQLHTITFCQTPVKYWLTSSLILAADFISAGDVWKKEPIPLLPSEPPGKL